MPLPTALNFTTRTLSSHTAFFGLQLWIVILIAISSLAIIVLVIRIRRRRKPISPISCKDCTNTSSSSSSSVAATLLPLDRRHLLLSRNGSSSIEMGIPVSERRTASMSRRWMGRQNSCPAGRRSNLSDWGSSSFVAPPPPPRWTSQFYGEKEIEAATNGFADENVIGCGNYGIVYRGVLFNGNRVAIKKLLYDSGTLEDFIAQVEAIGSAKHKNLVQLLGHCSEGAFRMLVYEYVDNGNLYQWLHGCTIPTVSPLTWSIRMGIVQSVAKGLAYLHEDFEPMAVHEHIKSSNIVLDHQWTPKISDLGVAKVLGPDWIHLSNSTMKVSGYIAPEYAYAGALDEKTDVYSFGVLLMEIITGKNPVENAPGSQAQVYLVDWLKYMVAEQNFNHIVDPKMGEMPPTVELKRVVLVALRCVDPDAEKRPRMGDVIHMLEPYDLLLNDDQVDASPDESPEFFGGISGRIVRSRYRLDDHDMLQAL